MTLRTWIAKAKELKHRHDSRISRHTYDANNAHWWSLDQMTACAWIKAEQDEQLLRTFVEMLHYDNMPWRKPMRGRRGGTKWEALNCAVKNRLWLIERDRDHASMGQGHNSRNAA